MRKREREQEGSVMADSIIMNDMLDAENAAPKKRGAPRALHCPHLPPYVEVRAVVLDDFMDSTGNSYPHGVKHFTNIFRCPGTKKDGKPCDYRRMLKNRYLPLTKFQNANGEIFEVKTGWGNPLACRTPGDVVREAQGQVEGPRGWHKFWYAVHHLGAHASGQQHASQEQIYEWVRWLTGKVKDFRSNLSYFQVADLLVEGGPGDGDAGVRAKFMRAQHVLQYYNVESSVRTFSLKRKPLTSSSIMPEPTSTTPATSETYDVDVCAEIGGDLKRVKPDVKTPQSPSPKEGALNFPAHRHVDFSDPKTVVSPQSLSCPPSGGHGEGVMAAFNEPEQYDSAEAFADSVWAVWPPDRTDADGGGGGWVGRENVREGLHDGFGEPTQVEYPIQFDFQ
jgi:hypothetical protein